jgi:hypothetical protein
MNTIMQYQRAAMWQPLTPLTGTKQDELRKNIDEIDQKIIAFQNRMVYILKIMLGETVS